MKTKILFLCACGLIAGCATPPPKPVAKISEPQSQPVPAAPAQQMTALKLFFDGRDYYTVATDEGRRDAENRGYHFVRTEGFVFTQPQNGLIPLKQYWSAPRHDFWLLAGNIPKNVERNGKYKFVRFEGYVFSNRQPGTVELNHFSQPRGDNFTFASEASAAAAHDGGYARRKIFHAYVIPVSETEIIPNMSSQKVSTEKPVALEQTKKGIEQLNLFDVKLKLLKVDSEETQTANEYGKNAVDNDPNTYWHTQWVSNSPALPHEIIIELVPPAVLKGFTYLPRQDLSDNGTIKDYEFYVSNDGKNFGQPVNKGTFDSDKKEKTITFDPVKCRFIKLKALSELHGQPWTSAAEIGVVFEIKDISAEQIQNWISQLRGSGSSSERNAAVEALAKKPGLSLPALEIALKNETDDDRRWWLQSAIQRCQEKLSQN